MVLGLACLQTVLFVLVIDPNAQDARDAEILHRLLDHEVVPGFYARDHEGLPQAWLARVKASLRTLGPRFCATRMLREYVDGPYRGG